MKIIVTALLVAVGLSGCIAVPVYDGPAYRSQYYGYGPGPYNGGYYGGYYRGGNYRYRSERYP